MCLDAVTALHNCTNHHVSPSRAQEACSLALRDRRITQNSQGALRVQIWADVSRGPLQNVTDSIPFLSTAVGIALDIVQKLTDVNENKDRCSAIAERIVQVFLAIAETFKDVDPTAVPSQTARNVEQLQQCVLTLIVVHTRTQPALQPSQRDS